MSALSLVAGLVLAAAPPFTWSFRQDDFRFEAILCVAAGDLDGDGRAELFVAGRNYQDGEACLEAFRWENNGFVLIWQSPNLLLPESSLLAVTVARADGPALVALTRAEYHVFRWRDGVYMKETSGQLPYGRMETGGDERAASGDVDGDGQDEVIVTTTLRNTKSGRERDLRVLAWRDGKLTPAAASEPIGNIRSVAAGDLDRDGRAEVAVELGVANKAGEFRLFRYTEGSLREIPAGKTKALMPGAVYGGLAIGRLYPEPGRFLLAASPPGRLRSFYLTAGGLAPAVLDLSFRGSPVSLACADLDGDGRGEWAAISYKARLEVLQPVAPPIHLRLDGASRMPDEPLQYWDGTVFAEAGSLVAALGWTRRAADGRSEAVFTGLDGRQHTLGFDEAALTVVLDGSPVTLTPGARTYRGFFFLPVEAVARLAGYQVSWDPDGRVLSITARSGA